MAPQIFRPEAAASLEPLGPRAAPAPSRPPLHDGGWWPRSADLRTELRTLVPILDHVRGRVTRLLLSAGGWATRPSRISTDGRTVTVGYQADRSPFLMTVLCADGGTFTLRVVPPGAVPAAPERTKAGTGEATWETEGGGLGLLAGQTAR
ncbi:DUF5994 family protein [Actinoplanes sp. NPDC048796]|uniref:DUF5994 family protein n=1 Tax=unclassified Actinoplanes TaxID=2626549 RepID=UPI0033DE3AEE